MPLGKSWLNDSIGKLPESEKPIATILFLSAFAPFTITEKDITNFRNTNGTDKELLEVCYWSIQIITIRISEWLVEPFNK